jgi:CBS domain containing-hemolysin-like protein
MEELTLGSFLFRGAAVLFLIAANAFFVAAEFALVASRRTRIDAMVRKGDTKAKLAQRAIQSLDRYISGTQLGITVASLGLGWIGEPAVAAAIESGFEFLPPPADVITTHTVAAAFAFLLITFLHIVLGELAPKAVALLHPEATSRWLAGPLIGFTVATNPFIWVLNGAANGLLRILGMRPPGEAERVHQPEEIMMLLRQTQQSGRLERQDVRMIEGVFEFTEKDARDVMTPRTDVIALPATHTLAEAAERIAEAGRSRYPVYGESLDDVVGIVHVKQVLRAVREDPDQLATAIMREPLFVPGTREVEDVLADMKRLKIHIAVVLDEYGGTAGIVTMEDLLEEIVGEIYDEYDRTADVPVAAGDGLTVPGEIEIDDLNRRYGLTLPGDDYITVGGYVFGKLGRLPRAGDRITEEGATLEVLEMDGKRVGKLRMVMSKQPRRGPEPKTAT